MASEAVGRIGRLAIVPIALLVLSGSNVEGHLGDLTTVCAGDPKGPSGVDEIIRPLPDLLGTLLSWVQAQAR